MNAIRKWRKAAKLTLHDAAPMLDVSKASLSRIERGDQWPDRDFFERLKAVTNGRVTPNDLLAADENLAPIST